VGTRNELRIRLDTGQDRGRVLSSKKSYSLEKIVPAAGLAYFATFAVALILRSIVTVGMLASYQLFFIPLAIFSAVCAVAIWWKPKVGFPAAMALSIVLMAIFFLTRDGNDVITVLSNPGRNIVQFFFYLTSVPQFFSIFIFSVLGLWNLRNSKHKQSNQNPGVGA
jgi:hypothetical protein